MMEILIKIHDNGYSVVTADNRFTPTGGQPEVQNKVFEAYEDLKTFLEESIPKHDG